MSLETGRTLRQWLDWIAGLHPQPMALGLQRVRTVYRRLDLRLQGIPLLVVAGTNGKGSTVAFMESILRAAGYRTATYGSPHLFRFNERIQVGGNALADDEIRAAFEVVERARLRTSLTYFEFVTLAALVAFSRHQPEVMVMEIGLGGRLDAVNILDADVGVITTVAEDHQAWLGPDRESIGREKAGIMRKAKPLICGDPVPPRSVLEQAEVVGACLIRAGADFHWRRDGDTWHWSYGDETLTLPLPSLYGEHQLQNAATAMAAIRQLGTRFDIGRQAIAQGLESCRLAGRFQVLGTDPEFVLDVAHNPQAAQVLGRNLLSRPRTGRSIALFSMCADKAIGEFARELNAVIDEWHVFPLQTDRGASLADITARLTAAGVGKLTGHAGCLAAWSAVLSVAKPEDRILVTGSFYTLAEVSALRVLPGLG